MAASLATGRRARRRLVAGGVLTLGALAAWRPWSAPAIPDLQARRRGELVFLARPGTSSVTTALGSGIDGARRSADRLPARTALEDAATAPALGNAAATSLVAFLDYRCGFCRRHAASLLAGARHGGFELLVRDWPILGPASRLAAEAALAAAEQAAYWPLHAALMATGFVPTSALVEDLARREGLDVDRLRAAMASKRVTAALARNAALARGLGAIGTPVYVIDGVVITGGWEVDTLLALAARHRA